MLLPFWFLLVKPVTRDHLPLKVTLDVTLILSNMGNSAPTSVKSLAALGKASRSKQRAPFLEQQPELARPKRTSPTVASQAVKDASAPGHRNPYYVPESTTQDPLAVPKAFGHDIEQIDPAQYQSATPLGAEKLDLSQLNIDAMQVKNEGVVNFVDQLSQSITHKPAPGAIPSLEEQILVLQFVGADPREIAALQDRLDAQNALKLEQEQPNAPEAPKAAAKPNTPNAPPRQERIFIDAHEILTQSTMREVSDFSRPSYAKSQLERESDPFPDSISAAHASRGPGPDPSDNEPMFRHDPLQNLPGSRSAMAARSRSTNPDIIRTVPGLATADQMDEIIRSGTIPDNFPITNPEHLQYLRAALKVAITQPVNTNERAYKSRISSRPPSM